MTPPATAAPARRRAASRPRGRARGASGARQRHVRRRRRIAGGIAVLIVGGVVALVAGVGPLGDAVRKITLPLKHEDIIRQQADEKDLDPALIAAVIYEESKFRDQTSPAGARGLMQITPETAEFIARRSGGIAFQQADLATPQVNISYGAYYLRYMLDRFDGNTALAAAAYNAGEQNAAEWVREAGGVDSFELSDIDFPETRHYVEGVLEHQRLYRKHYADELGL